MRIVAEPAGQRRLRAEFNIGFVGHHDGFAAGHLQQVAHRLRVDNLPGRVVRAADEDHLHAVQPRFDARQVELPVGQRRHGAALDADGLGADTVHAVGRRAVEHRVFAGLTEGADQQLDAFVGAAADQHLLRFDLGVAGVALNHGLRLRLRIAVQRLFGKLEGYGGREFVGVEPDVAFAAQPTSGLIRGQRADVGAG